MQKILILGGGSQLGRTFQLLYPDHVRCVSHEECDITQVNQLNEVLKTASESIVLNAAAITNLSYCESHPQECFAVNAQAVLLINNACKKHRKKLIHISSNYAVEPLNVYGKSKAKSEAFMDPSFLVIRTSFYSQKNYIINNLLLGSPTNILHNHYFNPISITRLVAEIVNNTTRTGLINIFSETCFSYEEFARTVCDLRDLPASTLVRSHAVTESFVRPKNACIPSDIPVHLRSDLEEYFMYLNQYPNI